MAPVTRWIVAGALGCAAVTLAYVPPRGATSTHRSPFVSQAPRATPARQHAQALADTWRSADAAYRLLAARRDLAAQLRAARAGQRSLVVAADSGGTLVPAPRLVDSAAHVAWDQLGLGETKIAVAFVFQLAVPIPRGDRPLTEDGIAAYLAPDSTDRTTCIAFVPAGPYWTRYVFGSSVQGEHAAFAQLVYSIQTGFGPCAFYAAFGTPSRTVRGWLNMRGWSLAMNLNPGASTRRSSFVSVADRRVPWYWDAIYALPPDAVACLAQRAVACRAVVLAGASDDPTTPVPDMMRLEHRYWNRVPRLVEGDRYLGDVSRAIGRERFLSFWTTSQPVDTALTLALKQPVGEWTAHWQRGFVQPIRLGPLPPAGGFAIACAIGALAIAIVTVTASRRQVR